MITKNAIVNEEKIAELSYGDRGVDIAHKVIKLSEEAGELSAAFLKYKGSKNVSATAKGKPIDVVEEAFDCINVALDIIFAVERESSLSREDIVACTEAKLNKWENKQKGY
jgi:NTP pyrophosphatase (non-canonical NTP hydrolase)